MSTSAPLHDYATPPENHMNSLPQKGLFHLNIHSLLPKIEELPTHVLSSPLKILSINETFLDL